MLQAKAKDFQVRTGGNDGEKFTTSSANSPEPKFPKFSLVQWGLG